MHLMPLYNKNNMNSNNNNNYNKNNNNNTNFLKLQFIKNIYQIQKHTSLK